MRGLGAARFRLFEERRGSVRPACADCVACPDYADYADYADFAALGDASLHAAAASAWSVATSHSGRCANYVGYSCPPDHFTIGGRPRAHTDSQPVQSGRR